MTFHQLVKRVAERLRVTQVDARAVLEAGFGLIANEVKAERRFAVPRFGVFYQATRKSRFVLNPQTGERMRIPGDSRLGFRSSKNQKRRVR